MKGETILDILNTGLPVIAAQACITALRSLVSA